MIYTSLSLDNHRSIHPSYIPYSEERLYHVGTTNPEITWKRVKKGDEVYIEGQHGGDCEEISYFKDTFGNENHSHLQQKHSDDVIDMIHVGLLRIE